jgi:hypothetical protein
MCKGVKNGGIRGEQGGSVEVRGWLSTDHMLPNYGPNHPVDRTYLLLNATRITTTMVKVQSCRFSFSPLSRFDLLFLGS